MVKANLVLPGNLIVTLATLGTLFFLVGIIQLVAAITGGIDFLGFSASSVASFAFQFFMPTSEWEVGLSVMIK